MLLHLFRIDSQPKGLPNPTFFVECLVITSHKQSATQTNRTQTTAPNMHHIRLRTALRLSPPPPHLPAMSSAKADLVAAVGARPWKETQIPRGKEVCQMRPKKKIRGKMMTQKKWKKCTTFYVHPSYTLFSAPKAPQQGNSCSSLTKDRPFLGGAATGDRQRKAQAAWKMRDLRRLLIGLRSF